MNQNTQNLLSRADYLSLNTGATREEQHALHRRYYGQLVSEATIAKVANYIGRDNLLASTDPRFNDIPLSRWDSLCGFGLTNLGYARGDQTQIGRVLPMATSFGALGDFLTPSGMVCVAKEAARQYVERENAKATG